MYKYCTELGLYADLHTMKQPVSTWCKEVLNKKKEMNGTGSDQIGDLKVFQFHMVSMPSLPKEKAGTISRWEDEIYYFLCKKPPILVKWLKLS